MADVIFRGVKNPANCSECFFWAICPCLADFDDYSAILDAVHDGDLVRHEECPILHLPSGHGRLIDADALMPDFAKAIWEFRDGYTFQWLLEHAPTIVPAEGGTDNG